MSIIAVCACAESCLLWCRMSEEEEEKEEEENWSEYLTLSHSKPVTGDWAGHLERGNNNYQEEITGL